MVISLLSMNENNNKNDLKLLLKLYKNLQKKFEDFETN